MEGKMFICKFCPFKTQSYPQLQWHSREEHESLRKKYYCSICPYSAAKKWKVEEHMQYHQYIPGISLFICNFCPFRSPKQCQLQRHIMFTHFEEANLKTFSCKNCSATFISKSGLKKHRKDGHYKDFRD